MATNDQFINGKPKLMYGFMRALLKALDLVKQNREVTMDTTMKFSEEVPIERAYDFSFARKRTAS